MSRLQANYDTSLSQHAELNASLTKVRNALVESESERARLGERIENMTTEYAKDKATLRKQFNEYKDRLVTLSNDVHEANGARREAEKHAVAAVKQAALLEKDNERLMRELTDAKDEARGLTEYLGEMRGQLSAADERFATERANSERLLNERNERVSTLSSALDEAQRLVRQYVPADVELAQDLIDERKAQKD